MDRIISTQFSANGYVHMGEYLMPSSWLARYDDPALPYIAELHVEMRDGGDPHPICTSLTLRAREGGAAISGAHLRLPITKILSVTAASVALRGKRRDGDPEKWAPVGESDLEDFYKSFRAAESTAGTKGGRPGVDDERLRLVARIYRGALPTGAPVEAVRVALVVSRTQAARLVSMARRRMDPSSGLPFLAPATEREDLRHDRHHYPGRERRIAQEIDTQYEEDHSEPSDRDTFDLDTDGDRGIDGGDPTALG